MRSKIKPQPLLRPQPPVHLVENLFVTAFSPSPVLASWAQDIFLNDDAPLRNDDHLHLIGASIGFLWASTGYSKGGRRVLGQTEDLRLASRGNAWQRARAEQQLTDWFETIPDFLITLDGHYCSQCSDIEFCALIEHELYHIGQECDEFGAQKFHRDSGQPKLVIKGHDVEEFVGVVRRYGVDSPDGKLKEMIIAAAKGPEIGNVNIARACGTCLRLAA